MTHSTCIVQFVGSTIDIVTDVPGLALRGVDLGTAPGLSAEERAAFGVVRAASERLFGDALSTHQAQERTPGTPEYSAKQIASAQDRERKAVELLVDNGVAKDADEARAMIAPEATSTP